MEDADWPEAPPADTGSCRLHPAVNAATNNDHNTKRLIKSDTRVSGMPVKPNSAPRNPRPTEKKAPPDTQ